MQRVSNVTSVELYLLKSLPPKIFIKADGAVPTTGWTSPVLSPRYYVTPPADGIQDLDFCATEPTGIVLEVVTAISAGLIIDRNPDEYWGPQLPLIGVRVHSASNAIVANYNGNNSAGMIFASTIGSDAKPWPWLTQPEKGPQTFSGRIDRTAPLTSLLGKVVRVYRTGDILTMDFNPDRANVEIDPANGKIVDVWFG